MSSLNSKEISLLKKDVFSTKNPLSSQNMSQTRSYISKNQYLPSKKTLSHDKIVSKQTDVLAEKSCELGITYASYESFLNSDLLKEESRQDKALKELNHRFTNSKHQYVHLKQKFLDSLDKRSKKILSSLEKNMDEKHFKQQIEPRIIQYMLKNTDEWLSDYNK